MEPSLLCERVRSEITTRQGEHFVSELLKTVLEAGVTLVLEVLRRGRRCSWVVDIVNIVNIFSLVNLVNIVDINIMYAVIYGLSGIVSSTAVQI